MKYFAVIDTNVLVSAMLKWDSVPGNILELAFDCFSMPDPAKPKQAESLLPVIQPAFSFSCHEVLFYTNPVFQ